jgi:hypothetical protein
MKTIKIISHSSFFLRLKISIRFLLTGVIEWDESNFLDEFSKALFRNDKMIKRFRKSAERVNKEIEKELDCFD